MSSVLSEVRDRGGATGAVWSNAPRLEVAAEVDLSGREPALLRGTIRIDTERAFHVVDVTDQAQELVTRSRVREGTCSVHSPHTTCAVRINERESGFLEDLHGFLEDLVPRDAYYRHDDFDVRTENLEDPETEPVNGHAHIKSMLLGAASEHVPVVDGELALGRWQRIFFIELDQARPRRIVLQAHGWT